MQITRETDYAVRCILHLSLEPGRVPMVNEIAGERNIPRSFLAKILQKLTRAGMVKSYRGSRGGFRLSKDPADITLRDVVEAMEGRVLLNLCAVEGNTCDLRESCSVHPVGRRLTAELAGNLEKHTFEKLAREETKRRKRGKGQ